MDTENLCSIIEFLEKTPADTRDSFHSNLVKFLGRRVIKKYHGHKTPATLIAFKSNGYKYIVKFEVSNNPSTTVKEIHWYRQLKSLKRKTNFTPRFYYGFIKKNIAGYILEFMADYFPLNKLIIKDRIKNDQLRFYFNRLINITEKLFYSNKRIISLPAVQKLYREKINNRLAEASQTPYLKNLLIKKEIIINDKVYPSLTHFLSQIFDSSLQSSLNPREVGFIHGDLYFGNVLVKGKSVKIIDPNGSSEMPIEYDYGKILHSIHGGYDFIHCQEKIEFKQSKDNDFYLSLTLPESYNDLFKFLAEKLSEEMFLRSLYSEALHFASMLPHHTQDKKETTILFLRSIQLFNELFKKLRSK